MFSNLKIGVRLIGGFLIVAGISAVVGAIGISNTAKINAMADDMYAMELMGLSYIKEANIELTSIGRARSNFLLATSEDERSRHLASIAKSTEALKANIGKGRPLFTSDRAKELFSQFDKVSGDYEREMKQALTMASAK